jgi:hypothetical protein
VSDAEVAEIPYTAFASKKGQAITARLIVRRVRDLNHKAGRGQCELFPVWRYHPVFTDSPVRHEALSVPSGGERTPPPGCRGSRVKLRAA